jgi:hypothetical protein
MRATNNNKEFTMSQQYEIIKDVMNAIHTAFEPKKYKLAIWHTTRRDDWDYESSEFPDLQECVDAANAWLQNPVNHHVVVTVDINGKRMQHNGRRLVGNDGEPYSTNPVYHQVFCEEGV